MIWTHLGCSFTLLFLFVMLVSTDTDSNSHPDPFLVGADPSLIFHSEVPLVRVRVFGQNFDSQNVGNLSLYDRQCSCLIRVNIVSYSRNEMNLSLSATQTTGTGIYHFVVSTSSGDVTSNVTVEVIPDPQVTDVRPKQVFSVGGIRLTIHGTGFNRSGSARIEVTKVAKVKNESLTSQDCAFRTDSKMICILPKLDVDDGFLGEDPSRQQIIGVDLLLENKILALPIHQSFNFTTERPIFLSTSGLFVYNPNKHSLLDISGRKILLGCSAEDYTVWLGSYECPITEATDDLLTFAPPKSRPKSSGDLDARFNCDRHDGALPLLVQLGDPKNSSVTFFIRCLIYEGSNDLAFQLGVGLGVGLFLLLLLAASVGMLVHLCLRYSKQKMKDMAWEHNIKVVKEFIEKKEKIENMACIPAILQMTSNIHEKNETSQYGIFGDVAAKVPNLKSKTDVSTQQKYEVRTTAEVAQTTPQFKSTAQDATSQDGVVEAQPSTSCEDISELNSQEEISQNLLFSDSVVGRADIGRNFLH